MPRVAVDLDDRLRSQDPGTIDCTIDSLIDSDDRRREAFDRLAKQTEFGKQTEPKLRAARRGQGQTVQSIRSESKPPRSPRPRLTFAAGGLICAVSFVVAMLLTKPARPPTPAMMTLAASTISDLRTLMAAVKAAGLRGTPDVKGAIDEITRVDSDRVTLKGWAVEIGDGSLPLAVMAFVDGHHRLSMETSGRNNETAAALGLSDAAAANVSFEGRLACSKGQKLILVAVAQSDAYGHFGSRLCP